MRVLGRLSRSLWGWLIFKLIFGVGWPLALLTFTPASLLASLGWVIYLVASTTLTGALISIVGLILSAQSGTRATVGLTVELVGILLMLVGPISYCLTLVTVATVGFGGTPGWQFIPSVFFSAGMVSAIVNRLLIVLQVRSRVSHQPGLEL